MRVFELMTKLGEMPAGANVWVVDDVGKEYASSICVRVDEAGDVILEEAKPTSSEDMDD